MRPDGARAVGLLALLLVWPLAGWGQSEGHRGRGGSGGSLDPGRFVRQLLEARLGRGVEWSGTALSGSPPALAVARFHVAGPDAGAPPALAGVAARLAFDWAALSSGRLVFDPLTVDEARLQLGERLALDLRDVRARAETRGPEAPILYDATAVLASGGVLAARGSAEQDGAGSGGATLSEVQLAPWRPLLSRVSQLAGVAEGRVEWARSGRAVDTLRVVVDLDGLRVGVRDVELEGPARLSAELAGLASGAGPGHFTLDARQAAMRYAQVYDKPAGVPARIEGQLERGADGRIGISELRVHIGHADSGQEPREPAAPAAGPSP